MKQQPDQPLAEIRIIELGGVLAVPYASMMLGDMGAEVIKIEKPGGDDTRHWLPPSINGESAYFLGVNRGKKSIVLDLKTDKGKEVLRALVLTADILIENISRGSLEKLGMSCAEMRALNPRLITCSIKGYARGTPKENDPGYDFIIQGRSGFMSITGKEDPMKAGFAVADIVTGLFAMNGILAALYAREKDGVGVHIEVPLLSAMVASMPSIAMNYLVSRELPKRVGNAHLNIVPYDCFNTRDGKQIIITVGNEKQWRAFCEAIEREWLLHDSKFATNADRIVNREELTAYIQQELLARTRDEWIALFEARNIPTGPIQNFEEVCNDPNVLQAGMLTNMKHPTAGSIWGINSPIEFGEGGVRRAESLPPPLLGEHTNSILLELGYSEDDIASVVGENIVV
ncbi:hypothetical protein A2673_04060 [Candidatus Kaiserbacteria bacterium RIFCSPHIGHO2_01_FULL_50_13]|uniref:Formyl-CoA transferase n=1 Tax=Candidatus Kaiserbacteria bacterium RIFCSPLOWO2_01_FULL_50_24 TaxID=1798507 RepID=A0A1F6ENC5_9BACT|nr:MAG: hypothetical protein A2673_04060 [Candidatus Kaiserbacteria bacterium RIFCSPHIGHO2_01_FULL_50_13]OGG75153.1 MAG: hypothetical protein A3A34_02245 [Candidatus Kaiserbacteria bacterium RIFCSPLOWO2_01_FULL_50_24]OGG81068.1 MAG: hypothetical protein A3H74_04065 [Candidatus Kaiserbacteria bacterium RIFCSPLOWO2_02_FULL_51_13]